MIVLQVLGGAVVVMVALTSVLYGWMRVEVWLAARSARRARAEALLRWYLPEVADPVDVRFEETREALLGLIPAAPLCPPALRRWKETEAALSADHQFTTAVADALRDSQT